MTDVLAKLFRTYVQELTYIIKQDIANLNQSIAGLQGFTNSNFPGAGGAAGKAGDKQVAEHNKNVLVMLQSKLADTSIGFKDILEIRTQVSLTPDHCNQLDGLLIQLTARLLHRT